MCLRSWLFFFGPGFSFGPDLSSRKCDKFSVVFIYPCQVQRLTLTASKLQALLRPELTEDSRTAQDSRTAHDLKPSFTEKLLRKKAYANSIRIGEAVWKTSTNTSKADEREKPGHMFEDTYEDHIAALTVNAKAKDTFSAPFDVQRSAAASFVRQNGSAMLDSIMDNILESEPKPNCEQESFLKHFIRRMKMEILEKRSRTVNASNEEPLLDLVHGFPGTGKSMLIAWMRRLMEEGLGWEHGVQFVCLAFQNAMAAAINGFTVHHWSGIPARSIDGNSCGDKHQQSMKCQALRVIIIDEVSMISAELLGALEYVVKGAVRVQETYKKRNNGNTRAFGGVNVIMCADFWQLQPVTGTFLASDPTVVPPGRAQNALSLFWEEHEDSIRSFWPLTQVMRCLDPWYNKFLAQCRSGNLSMNEFCFLHGLPTFTSPCNDCQCNSDLVQDPIVGSFRKRWKERFVNGCSDMSRLIQEEEDSCENCKTERLRRQKVLTGMTTMPVSLQKPPFSSAPALYSFNVPRYFCTNVRAREFCKQSNVQLSWCYAKDIPLHPGDRELKAEALQNKLLAWLRRHDQETSHLPSIYPLAVGMPIRLTENVDRNRQLYRGRQGTIYGWTLAAGCIPEEVDGEFLLNRLPVVIYLRFPSATWQIGKLPKGVYPLKPRSRTWKVNKYTGIEARRTGFWFLPDFGSTAHMIQGATLEAAFADLQEASCNVSSALQIAGYVCLSRIKELEKICILQAFSPLLFTRGPPAGPQRLIQKLQKEMTIEECFEEWAKDTTEDDEEKRGAIICIPPKKD